MSSSKPSLSVSRPKWWVVPHMQTCLRLLGFVTSENKLFTERVVNDKLLFDRSDHEAFHQVGYFLLHRLDAAWCASHMRDAWPVLERRQHADFRKQFALCYKELQLEHKTSLPMLNVSLLQTPGGPKFLYFMLALTNFVVERVLRRSNVSLKTIDTSMETKEAVEDFYNLATNNLTKTKSEKLSSEKEVADLKELIHSSVIPRYDQVELELQSLSLPEDLEELSTNAQLLKSRVSELTSKMKSLERQKEERTRIINVIHENFISGKNLLDLSKLASKGDTEQSFVDVVGSLMKSSSQLLKILQAPVDMTVSLEDIANATKTFRVATQSLQEQYNLQSQSLQALKRSRSHLEPQVKEESDWIDKFLSRFISKPLQQVKVNLDRNERHNQATNRFVLNFENILKPYRRQRDQCAKHSSTHGSSTRTMNQCEESLEDTRMISGHHSSSYAARPTFGAATAFETSKLSNFEPVMSSSRFINSTIKSSVNDQDSNDAFSPIRLGLTSLSNNTGVESHSHSPLLVKEPHTSSPMDATAALAGNIDRARIQSPVVSIDEESSKKRAPIRLSEAFIKKSVSSSVSNTDPMGSATTEELWTRLDSLAITLADEQDSDEVFMTVLDGDLV